jgi:hypothetical protein
MNRKTNTVETAAEQTVFYLTSVCTSLMNDSLKGYVFSDYVPATEWPLPPGDNPIEVNKYYAYYYYYYYLVSKV